MELYDMGYKPKKTDMSQPVNAEEPKVQYPHMYIDRKVPASLMDKEVGAMCRLEVVAKIVSKSVDDRGEDNVERLELQIHKLGYIGNAGKKTREEYLNSSEEEREEYDKKTAGVDEKEEE